MCLVYFISGCIDMKVDDESNNEDLSQLYGRYISECYYSPLLEMFVIENIEYSRTSYTNQINQYTSIDCSTDIEDTLHTLGSITYQDKVITTDGLTASRVYFDNQTGGIAPDFDRIMLAVYRKDEDKLNFGFYTEGEIPTVNYSVTYFKQ